MYSPWLTRAVENVYHIVSALMNTHCQRTASLNRVIENVSGQRPQKRSRNTATYLIATKTLSARSAVVPNTFHDGQARQQCLRNGTFLKRWSTSAPGPTSEMVGVISWTLLVRDMAYIILIVFRFPETRPKARSRHNGGIGVWSRLKMARTREVGAKRVYVLSWLGSYIAIRGFCTAKTQANMPYVF